MKLPLARGYFTAAYFAVFVPASAAIRLVRRVRREPVSLPGTGTWRDVRRGGGPSENISAAMAQACSLIFWPIGPLLRLEQSVQLRRRGSDASERDPEPSPFSYTMH